MYLFRICVAVILILKCVSGLFFMPSSAESGLNAVQKASRWNMPWLGIGLWCNGCPATGCEDDEAIIHGYCCGCAYAMAILATMDKDKEQELREGIRQAWKHSLPVLCPQFLQCPLNLHGLCHDYEYMMRCCC